MSAFQMTTPYQQEWIKRFDPQKRILTGNAYLVAKRIVDLVLVGLSFPVWGPLMGIISLIIFVTSAKPILFVQQRTGRGGRRFKMYKFRSMVPNAEELKKELAAVNASGDLTG